MYNAHFYCSKHKHDSLINSQTMYINVGTYYPFRGYVMITGCKYIRDIPCYQY